MKMMETKAYTTYGKTGFSKMGFGETGRHRSMNAQWSDIVNQAGDT